MAFYIIFKLFLIVISISLVLSEKPSIHGFPLEDAEVVSIEKVPYQASLLYYGFIFICSGIIISDDIILTAAHCTMGDPSQWLIQVGSSHKTEDGQKYAVDKIVIHEKYYKGDSDYDISLFILPDKMLIDGVTTVIVPIVPPDYVIPDDVNEGFTASWGASGNENITDPLKATNIPILEHSKCEELFSSHEDIKITENILCAGYSKDFCRGDSGAPLTIDCFLVGISTNVIGCAGKGIPGIWIKISSVSTWLQAWIDGDENFM